MNNCNDCIQYKNDDMFDGTKCVPISSGNGCKSWEDVQNDKTPINYQCNWNGISTGEKSEISELIYM